MNEAALLWAFRQRPGSSTNKLVLLMLAQHADAEGVCHLLQRDLARECELGRVTINGAIKELSRDGYIEIEAQQGAHRGRGHRRAYRLNISSATTATRWIWRQVDLTAPQKLILSHLADHCGDDGLVLIRQRRIVDDTGLSAANVSRGISHLCQRGFIKRIQGHGKGVAYRILSHT